MELPKIDSRVKVILIVLLVVALIGTGIALLAVFKVGGTEPVRHSLGLEQFQQKTNSQRGNC